MSKKKMSTGILCPVCLDHGNETYLQPTGKIFLVHPMKRLYKCRLCGYQKIIEKE